MSAWHGDSHKKKHSGGRKRAHRKKRKFEQGLFPAQTTLGETKRKIHRRKSGFVKIKLLRDKYVCVTDSKSGKTERVEISRVTRNPTNVDYDRRGVITKGAIIETPKGLARVTSRPGQNGVVNAVFIEEEQS